jgi:hypothetical protein
MQDVGEYVPAEGIDADMKALVTTHVLIKEKREERERLRREARIDILDEYLKELRNTFNEHQSRVCDFLSTNNHTQAVYKSGSESFCVRLCKAKGSKAISRTELHADLVRLFDHDTATQLHNQICNEFRPLTVKSRVTIRQQSAPTRAAYVAE